MIVVAPEGLGGRALDPVVDRLCELGAKTLIIGEARGVAGGTMDLPLDDLGTELPSPVSPVLNMLLQLLAWHLVRQRRIDPDQPRTIPEDHRDRQIHPDLRLSCV
jgi:glutamine---fructose-6-phosphate transaminase (isomerizing)